MADRRWRGGRGGPRRLGICRALVTNVRAYPAAYERRKENGSHL
jgi:hypothetical protein